MISHLFNAFERLHIVTGRCKTCISKNGTFKKMKKKTEFLND